MEALNHLADIKSTSVSLLAIELELCQASGAIRFWLVEFLIDKKRAFQRVPPDLCSSGPEQALSRSHLLRNPLTESFAHSTMAADPVTKTTVDSLLNYGVDDDDDPFKDIDASLAIRSTTRDDKAILSPRKRSAADADILGLDEEVQIKKKRKPVAKLDEARLVFPLFYSISNFITIVLRNVTSADSSPRPASQNSAPWRAAGSRRSSG